MNLVTFVLVAVCLKVGTSSAANISENFIHDLRKVCSDLGNVSSNTATTEKLNIYSEDDDDVWEIVSSSCGGVVKNSLGIISFDWNNISANKGESGRQYCVWTIHAQKADMIRFKIIDVSLRKKDWISFTPLSSMSETYLFSRDLEKNTKFVTSNSHSHEDIFIAGSVVFVVYSKHSTIKANSKPQNMKIGFEKMQIPGYSNFQSGRGISNFHSSEGTGSFSHPGNDSGLARFLPNTLITYVIAQPPNSSVKHNVILEKMDMTENSLCSDDSLERFVIQDNLPSNTLTAVGGMKDMKRTRYCGKLNSTGEIKMGQDESSVSIIVFRSDYFSTGKGFRFSWK